MSNLEADISPTDPVWDYLNLMAAESYPEFADMSNGITLNAFKEGLFLR